MSWATTHVWRFGDVFPLVAQRYGLCVRQAIDALHELLDEDPTKRATAERALSFRYFRNSKLRSDQVRPACVLCWVCVDGSPMTQAFFSH